MQLTIINLITTLFCSISLFCTSLSLYAQTTETPQAIKGLEFSICKGETIHLSSINQPPAIIQVVDEQAQDSDPKSSLENPSTLVINPTGPLIDYNCMPPVLEVIPNKDWTLDENGVLLLSPNETTSYKIKYVSVDQCPNGRPSNVTINVACNAQNNKITNDFEWLDDLTNDDGCGISLIDVYEKNNSKFVYVEAIDAKVLYYEDGSVLCTDARLCLNYYNLSNKKNSWSCEQMKDNEEAANKIFGTYNWLEREVDKANCTNETIAVYNMDTYKFIVIYNGYNGYKIYDETGTYSYFSAIGFSFLDDVKPQHSWACDGNFSIRKAANNSVEATSFQLFPNPTKNKVFLNLNNINATISNELAVNIYTVSGLQVLNIKPQDSGFFVHILELDISQLTKGMYVIELQSNDQLFYEKLLIE